VPPKETRLNLLPRFLSPGGRLVLLFAGLTALASGSEAQELIPDAYKPAPVGFNGISASGTYNWGDITFDPSIPVEDGSAQLGIWTAGYFRTLNLAGRSGQAAILVPYVVGHVEGVLLDEFRTADRHGFGDLVLRGAVNLLGAPAMGLKEFAAYTPRTTLGASLIVVAPVGQYDPTKLINLGGNRWAVKPELGLSRRFGHFILDGYAAVWFFTRNSEFFSRNVYFPGTRAQTQDPIAAFEAHLSYDVRPGLWISLDANFWYGGRTSLDGVENPATLQQASRIGVTASIPLTRRHSLKVGVADGAYVRFGGDYKIASLAWQYAWIDKPR
jgi:hypothetical protein